MDINNMQYVRFLAFRGVARIALALSLVGLATVTASAGGKSPPPAYDVTFDNVTTDFLSFMKITLPKVEVKGANIAKADIEKMFASDTPVADRIKALTAFSAGSVEIPTLAFSLGAGPLKLEGSYDGNKLEKIAGGKIGKYSYSGMTANYLFSDDTPSQSVKMNLKAGKGETADFDFVLAYRVWNDKAGADDKEPQPLFSTASMDSMTIDYADRQTTLKSEYGKFTTSSGSKIRPLSRPLKDIAGDVAAAMTQLAKGEMPPEANSQIRAAGLGLVELLENYRMESSVMDGYTFTQTMTDPAFPAPITVSGKIGKMESRPQLIQLSNMDMTADKAKVKIGAMSVKDFSFDPLIATARASLSNPSSDLEKEATKILVSLYANLGTMTVSDFDVAATVPDKAAAMDKDETNDDAPKPADPAAPATVDLNVRLKTFTLRSEKPVNGLPSSVRLAIDNLQMPTLIFGLSGKPSDVMMAQQLKQLGYENLDMSLAMDSSWNRDTRELAINEIKAAEVNTGSLVLKGTIGNFTENMFTTDETVFGLSALGLLAKDVSLYVEDRGGLDRALKLVAEQRGVTMEQLKASAPLMLSMIPEPFASLPSVAALKKALLQFWENPGTLDVAIKSKSGSGLGIADFMAAAKDPAGFETKIDVTATATK